MSNSITLQERITIGGETFTYNRTKTAGSLKSISEPVDDSETDLEIALVLDVSACQFFAIVADQALTIETNDGTTPDNTIALVANEPYIWAAGMADTFLIDTDITSIFATNSSGEDATLTIYALEDPTP